MSIVPDLKLISSGDQGFVIAGVVALIVLACYNQATSPGVWRVSFGLGFVVCALVRKNHSLVLITDAMFFLASCCDLFLSASHD